MTKGPDTAALQEAIDKLAIGELQSRYMYALDWRDPDLFASLFTENAILEWAEGKAKGRDEIRAASAQMRAFYSKLAEGSAPKKPPRLRHFVTNRVFEINGDHARSWAYWLDLNNDNVQRWPYVAGYGYYVDDLVRTAGGWRFARRQVTNEITGESSLDNPIASQTQIPEDAA